MQAVVVTTTFVTDAMSNRVDAVMGLHCGDCARPAGGMGTDPHIAAAYQGYGTGNQTIRYGAIEQPKGLGDTFRVKSRLGSQRMAPPRRCG